MDKWDIESLAKEVSLLMDKIISESIDDRGLTIEDAQKKKERNKKLSEAMKNCGVGDKGAKGIVKNYISDILEDTLQIDKNNINDVINFNKEKSLSIMDKFDILLLTYQKQYGYDALKVLIDENKLDDLRKINGEYKYIITKDDIEKLYFAKNVELSFEDKLEIISQRIYQKLKGLGAIDQIRDMNIDGLSVGVSGIPKDFLNNAEDVYVNKLNNNILSFSKSFEGIWLYYKGKEIYMNFISLQSYKELERVAKNTYRYNLAGELSRDKGSIKVTNADNSRVVVFRPPHAESWAFFIRKIGVDVEFKTLLVGKNADKVMKLEGFLAKAYQSMIITGPQGAGKSTHMMGIIKEMYSIYTLRVWESKFEMNLRVKMPDRNILTIQETPTIDGEKGIDSLKTTNGAITIIHELAENKEISYAIKIGDVGSKCIVASHHSNTFDGIIRSFRNAIISTGLFKTEDSAEEQIVNIINFNPHLETTPEGFRYLERLTECIPEDNHYDFLGSYGKNIPLNEKIEGLIDATLMYYKMKTKNKKYKAVNIVEYDFEKQEYVFKNKISDKRINIIRSRLFEEDRKEFDDLIKEIF
ncbi:MAG: ATPase, T2SS/T4P/T4SS family [Bacilli bacterium]